MDAKTSQLKQTLNLKDLVLLNVACIIAFSTLTQAAQFGLGSMFLYVLAIITFLLPGGLMVIELNYRLPAEGGFYNWTKIAFGSTHAYLVAWSYWLSNIVWLPTVLFLISTSSIYIFSEEHWHYANSPAFNTIISLTLLWIVTGLNILGLEKAKWVQNIGGIAIWVCMLLLVLIGAYFVNEQGLPDAFTLTTLFPDFSDFGILPFFAAIAFGFGGLELSSVMGGEIKNPQKTLPRSIYISALLVCAIYMVITLMLLIIIPAGEVDVLKGVVQAFTIADSTIGLPFLGEIGAILVVFGTVGLFGAWMTGTARLPFVIGLDNYLPERLAKLHPKYGTPYIALLVQGVILSLFFIASMAGTTITEAFLILFDMSIILYFIPFLYMFAAWMWHQKHNTGNGLMQIFKNRNWLVYAVSGVGFGLTAFAMVMSCVPTKEINNKPLFLLKVIGGAVLLLSIGLIAYWRKRHSAHKFGQ